MKKITIEALLQWAFTEELPKVGTSESAGPSAAPSTWGVLSDVITLGTMVDKSPNKFGVISGYVWQGEPHPDALVVGRAVRALAERDGYEVAEGWNPFPEWPDDHGVIRAEVERIRIEQVNDRSGRLNGKHVVHLVTTSAILKRGPEWQAEQPKIVMVERSGKPAWFVMRKAKDSLGRTMWFEDNGFDQKRQRPVRNAYRKWRLAGSIRSDVISRLEWQIWQSALEVLHESLMGRLSGHDLLPFTPDRHPWAPRRKQVQDLQVTEITPK